MNPRSGLYMMRQVTPTTTGVIIVGSRNIVRSSPMPLNWRLSSSATPRPMSSWATTDTLM
jgi:hypothetical protein